MPTSIHGFPLKFLFFLLTDFIFNEAILSIGFTKKESGESDKKQKTSGIQYVIIHNF